MLLIGLTYVLVGSSSYFQRKQLEIFLYLKDFMVAAVNLNVIVQTWIIAILLVVIVSANRAIEEENVMNHVQIIHMEMAAVNSVNVMLQCHATM